jgi:carbamoyltransferase
VIFGFTIGHDASISIADRSGNILFAAGEERFSRVKGHMGAPYKALEAGVSYLNISRKEISEIPHVIAGTINTTNLEWFYNLLLSKNYQAKFDIFNGKLPPGLLKKLKLEMNNFSGSTEFKFKSIFEKNLGYKINSLISINHHDAHAASAFFPSGFNESYVLTLDGSGDGESGTVRRIKANGEQKIITRIPDKYSIGHLYSEVTKRYGFKESRHEGKITGLAAYSSAEPAKIHFENIFKSGLQCGLKPKYKFDYRFRNPKNLRYFDSRAAFKLAVERTEAKCLEYSDLAKSMQLYLEKQVSRLILDFTKSKNFKLALAGGVFSNVALNGMIRENFSGAEIYIYPNMGDGGLSSGVIWEYLRNHGQIYRSSEGDSMFLGTDLDAIPRSWNSMKRTPQDLAKQILDQQVIGVISGRMEFGPRALCHRSILASPTDSIINTNLNARLNRTEFMPFAPVVRDVDFEKVFCNSNQRTISNFKNFHFMTETCFIRDNYRVKLQAVVHKDGTARPQILKRVDNEFVYDALTILSKEYDLPAVINTSFNAHEEPIIENLAQAKKALESNKIDKLYIESNEIVL